MRSGLDLGELNGPDTSSRPNIVLILADDLGFSDLGCYGGEIPTPHLDRLAQGGVRMSQFYVNPRCSPSRASLLTGRYAHEAGIGVLTSDDRPFGYRGDLAADIPTIAERLKAAGYRTCLSGKWHLSTQTRQPTESWPTRRGFDDFFGIVRGATSYYQPKTLTRGEHNVEQEADTSGFYLTEALAAHADAFIEDAADSGDPFFLYFAPTAPHWPLQAPAEAISAQRGRYDEGWVAARQARYRRLLELGVLDEAADLSEGETSPDEWGGAETDRAWEARRMEVYAAQVSLLDAAVGTVLDAVARTGTERNTLIVFLSDNGACEEDIAEPGKGRRLKADTCPPVTRDGRPVRVGNDPRVEPGPEDTFASYGRRWANVSNTPFRMYKRWVHEGGIAAPLIARWPDGGIANGGIDQRLGHIIDLVPTLLAAAGLELPPELPGIDLTARWQQEPGGSSEDHASRPVFWEHVGNAAIRRGRWKLVRETDGPWELYDMAVDRSELDNLAAAHRELVDELAREWEHWASRAGVIPWGDIVAAYVESGRDASAAAG